MYIEWTLPVREGIDGDLTISHNAKIHCFVTHEKYRFNINRVGTSLCGRHQIYLNYYEKFNIFDVDEEHICKRCLQLYRKNYKQGVVIDDE